MPICAGLSRASFEFGLDGKPFYIPGPTETRAQIRRRIGHLHARFGAEAARLVADF